MFGTFFLVVVVKGGSFNKIEIQNYKNQLFSTWKT